MASSKDKPVAVPVRRSRRRWIVVVLAVVAVCGFVFVLYPVKRLRPRDSVVLKAIQDRGGGVFWQRPFWPRMIGQYLNVFGLNHYDPKSEVPFEVTILNATRDEFAEVRRYRSIVHLGLYGGKVDDELLKTLAELPTLVSLSLYDFEMTDEDLKRVVDALRRPQDLQSIKLRNTSITDQGLSVLSKCTLLFMIDIDGSRIQGTGLSRLSSLRLMFLTLKRSQLGDDAIPKIVAQWGGTLRQIDLEGNPVTDAGLGKLVGCPGLYVLGVGGTQATPDGVRELVSRQTMSGVMFNDLPWTMQDLAKFNISRKGLNRLELAGWNINDDDLKSLPNMPSLTILDLSGTEITDAGLKELARFPTLSILKLDGTQVTLKGVAELGKVLTTPGQISLGKTGITYKDLIELPTPLPYQNIVLDGMGLTNEELRSLVRKNPKCSIKADDRFFMP
ncbi:MAG: hypothetical protein KDA68_20450 [Planctomycetaceae bacterium]|nr:hypothetical protein [Planctomycetaceae bacterium]